MAVPFLEGAAEETIRQGSTVLYAAIGEVIERHMIEIGFLGVRSETMPPSALAVRLTREGAPAHFCPRCGEASFVKLEGCDSCLSCGYSKCS